MAYCVPMQERGKTEQQTNEKTKPGNTTFWSAFYRLCIVHMLERETNVLLLVLVGFS